MTEQPENTPGAIARILRNHWFQAASVIGVILGLIGFFIGLPPVSNSLFGKRMALSLEIVSEIPVFDVRRPLPGLSVTLNGRDLTSAKLELVASRVRLRNTGDIGVTPQNTTPIDPLRIVVSGGRVVRHDTVSASSDHLQRMGALSPVGATFALQPGIIIDPGDYITYDIVVLRTEGRPLRYSAFGKVEGLRTIEVVTATPRATQPSALKTAWTGGIVAQLLRMLTYPFIAIASLAALIIPIAALTAFSDRRKRRKRRRYALDAAASISSQSDKIRKLVPLLYERVGRTDLLNLKNWLTEKNVSRLRKLQKSTRMFPAKSSDSYLVSDFAANDLIERLLGQDVSYQELFVLLERIGLADLEAVKLDEALQTALGEFVAALEDKLGTEKLDAVETHARDMAERDPMIARVYGYPISEDELWQQRRLKPARARSV